MANEYISKHSAFTATADAIREKGESADPVTWDEETGFEQAVLAIKGGGVSPQLIVTAQAGSTITAVNGEETVTGVVGSEGTLTLDLPAFGEWTVTATLNEMIAEKTVDIKQEYAVKVLFETLHKFTYDGDYEIVDDNDNPIISSQGNWKIRFLTGGTLVFTELMGESNSIDVFVVGGGAGGTTSSAVYGNGGGGGGYTMTGKDIKIETGLPYEIVVGAGGAARSRGGGSSAFGVSADGGYSGGDHIGGKGGSGGGAGVNEGTGGAGGADGESGANSTGTGSGSGGEGQIETPGPNGETGSTREFGDTTGKLYAGGGGGGVNSGIIGAGGDGGGGKGAKGSTAAIAGTANTGGGGGGGNYTSTGGAKGGSGIVIIRNARR